MKKRKGDILAFIKKFMLENQYPPTVREIGKGVGLSSSATVKAYLDILVKDGEIIVKDSSPRTIQIPGIEYREV